MPVDQLIQKLYHPDPSQQQHTIADILARIDAGHTCDTQFITTTH